MILSFSRKKCFQLAKFIETNFCVCASSSNFYQETETEQVFLERKGLQIGTKVSYAELYGTAHSSMNTNFKICNFFTMGP